MTFPKENIATVHALLFEVHEVQPQNHFFNHFNALTMKHIIQPLLFMLTLCLSAITVKAQTPQAFNYQGVARDAAGNPIGNRTIATIFTIGFLSSDGLGSSVYSERHTLRTSNSGLFSAKIGTGTPDLGIFSEIPWGASGTYDLTVFVDMAGGTNYVQMGDPTQLISVPYALHAATCDEVLGGNWVDLPNFGGTAGTHEAIMNANQKTVVITPTAASSYALLPGVVHPALIVDGFDRPTAGYFRTDNLSLDASAIKAEIIGYAGAFHTDPAAVRGKAIVTGGDGIGGVGGEFEGGEHGIIARSTTGNAGLFEGDVEMSRDLSVNRMVSTPTITLNGAYPTLAFERANGAALETIFFQGPSEASPKLVLNRSSVSPGGAYLQALMSVDEQGRMAVGSNEAGPYSMSVQQNDNYGFALTKDGSLNSTWEFFLVDGTSPDRKNLQLYSANAFIGQFNPITGAYTPYSDRKFKSDIRPLSTVISEVKKLNLVSYQTKQDASGARHNGVIAQELEQVFPEYVTVGQDRDGAEVRSVDYAGLSIVALKAIQEQEARLEKLEKTNAALMARLEKLEAKR